VKTQDFGLEALGNWKTFREDDDATLDWDRRKGYRLLSG